MTPVSAATWHRRPAQAPLAAPQTDGVADASAPAAAQTPPSVSPTPAAQPTPPAPADNPLTTVSATTVGSVTTPSRTDPASSAGPSPAGISGANLNVIRQAAHGAVNLPDLGRVSVTATPRDGGVDVHVAASHSGGVDALVPHAAAMEADVRSANVPLLRLDFSTSDPRHAILERGHWPQEDGNAGAPRAKDEPRSRSGSQGSAPGTAPRPPVSTRRVRIAW